MKRFALCIAMFTAMTLVGTAWADKDKEEQPLRLELDLVDGSRIIGIPGIESVPMQTSYAKMDVPLKQILTIKMGEDHEIASIDLRNGDKLKGTISLGPIKLETVFGKVAVGIEHIKDIRVVLTGNTLPETLKQSLVLHYSFDRTEDGKVTDRSGKNNSGEVKGAKWTPKGKVGGAYQVGKGLGHIQTSDKEAWSFGTKPFSICLWFNPSALPSGEQMLIGHDDGGGELNKWAFEILNGNIDFHVNTTASASARIASCPWTPQVGKWYHLAVTRNGSTYSIYIDGVCVATDQNSSAIPPASAPLTIGQAEGLYVEGMLDEVMIFDRSLTGEEAKQIYDTQK